LLRLSSPRVKSAIVKAGGIRPLVRLVSMDCPGASQAAAKALWNLSLVDAYKRLIGQEGAVKPLVQLLRHGAPAAREAAAGALWNLSQDEANKAEINACGGLNLRGAIDRRAGSPTKAPF